MKNVEVRKEIDEVVREAYLKTELHGKVCTCEGKTRRKAKKLEMRLGGKQ